MKITKQQLRRIIKEEKKTLTEAYNSISPRSKSLANAAKRQFAKDYPDVQVGIDGREGWITVNGNKAVNMSQASGSPLSMEDIIDQMKQAYLGHTTLSQEVPGSRPGEHKLDFGKDIGTYNYRNEGAKMKITKRQLRRIIKEEKRKLLKEQAGDATQIIAQGKAFFDAVIELSHASEDDPSARDLLDQIEAALSDDVEERSYGYVKFKIS